MVVRFRSSKALIFGTAILFATNELLNPAVAQESLPSWLTPEERNNIGVYARVASSVVNISNIQFASRSNIFESQTVEVPAGVGSGFLWDSSGHIITNYHVIEGIERGRGKLTVAFRNGKTVDARVVGAEPRKDIAVLKVVLPADLGAQPIPVADSGQVLVGQTAIAIGSPFGLEQSMSRGIISALGRSIPGVGGPTIRHVIQTDASVNPGNSGGPLLDSRGHLIGMNTAIYSKSGSSAGISFAIPSNTVQRIAAQIIRFGKVKQVGFGIEVFRDEVSARMGVDGVVVMNVAKGGGGDLGGLRGTKRKGNGDIIWGDVIVRINNAAIANYDDLYNALDQYEAGIEVDVAVNRQGKMTTLRIRLGELP